MSKIDHQVDYTGFNKEYYQNHSLEDFIKDTIAGVPEKYGSDKEKKEWLTGAWQKITGKEIEKPEASKAVKK